MKSQPPAQPAEQGEALKHPTPLTDAHLKQTQTSPGPNIWASAEFTRALESRLAEAQGLIREMAELLTDIFPAQVEDTGFQPDGRICGEITYREWRKSRALLQRAKQALEVRG